MIDGLLARMGYIRAEKALQTPAFLRAGLDQGQWHPEVPGYDLAGNQVELYQRLSWVYIAVSNLAQSAAGARLNVKRLDEEKEEDIPNHPFEMLLRRPNPLQSRFELLTATFAYRPLAGNCYWWLNRRSENAPPTEIWIIPPYQIKPVPDGRMYLKGYLYDPGDGSQAIPLEPWEIVHFKNFHPKNRFVGMSAIEALATTAVGDLAMQQWNTNFFSKDNAKPAGALAYADPINNTDWETMKADVKREHGGTERRMMMLRNAGKGGVQWIQMGLNQKDMEFLQARTFNKEEIFAAFAPGLASMLAVNATEANSVAGKATFNDLAVWPAHQAVGEKITNDILTAYDGDLVAEFDDVRLADRTMDLQEQQAAYKVMTVKEVRERYYQLPPLGDERDKKLVDGPSETPPQLQAVNGVPAQDAPNGKEEVAGETTSDDMPDEEEMSMKADLDRWRRKAIKAVKAGKDALVKFESEDIPVTLAEAIKGALEAATNVEAVMRVFNGAMRWESYP